MLKARGLEIWGKFAKEYGKVRSAEGASEQNVEPGAVNAAAGQFHRMDRLRGRRFARA